MTKEQKPFDDCREWEVVAHHPCIRYRPRRRPVGETLEVTLPLARIAAEGKLVDALGEAYESCAARVGLRLGPGSSVGQLDLMLLSPFGAVALGECKLALGAARAPLTRSAIRQILRYERQIRGAEPSWLRERIADSYDRFGFPDGDQLLTQIGVKNGDDQYRWWTTVSDTIKHGAFDIFVAVRTRGEVGIDVWRRSRVSGDDPASIGRGGRHNKPFHLSTGVAPSGRSARRR